MTLFDGKPLTEREVALRFPCTCGHSLGAHRGGTNCTKCECEEYLYGGRDYDEDSGEAGAP